MSLVEDPWSKSSSASLATRPQLILYRLPASASSDAVLISCLDHMSRRIARRPAIACLALNLLILLPSMTVLSLICSLVYQSAYTEALA